MTNNKTEKQTIKTPYVWAWLEHDDESLHAMFAWSIQDILEEVLGVYFRVLYENRIVFTEQDGSLFVQLTDRKGNEHQWTVPNDESVKRWLNELSTSLRRYDKFDITEAWELKGRLKLEH